MKYIEKYEQKIKGLNKWLARTKKGSKNREKVKKKLAEVYRKLKMEENTSYTKQEKE